MRYWLDKFSTGYIDPQTHKLGITAQQSSEIVSLLCKSSPLRKLYEDEIKILIDPNGLTHLQLPELSSAH